MTPTFSKTYLGETAAILDRIDTASVERVALRLANVRERSGRVFTIGSGGGAAHASHAVCDLRKLLAIEAYSPADNLAELTARVNDEGWATSYGDWLVASRIDARDAVFVFSVGGGDVDRNVSPNIVGALEAARTIGATILGIVGRDGGHTARLADDCIVVPALFPTRLTTHTEGLQSVLWHLLVSHPRLARGAPRWESLPR